MSDDDTKIIRQKLNNWKRLAIARGRMLAAYRIGSSMPGTALDEAGAARKKLHALGEDKA